MNDSGGMARVFSWIGLAVAIALMVIFFAFLFQGGTCNDAAVGQRETSCTTGPAVGVGAAWGIAVTDSIVVVFATVRAVAIGRRLEKTAR